MHVMQRPQCYSAVRLASYVLSNAECSDIWSSSSIKGSSTKYTTNKGTFFGT